MPKKTPAGAKRRSAGRRSSSLSRPRRRTAAHASITSQPAASAAAAASTDASSAAKSGDVPTTTDAREEPASRIASVKSICETPGASSPASAKTASSLGRASSPVPGSTTAPTTTTRSATVVVATAPVSASGCARSATRRATVIAPKRRADARARRTAATAAHPTRRPVKEVKRGGQPRKGETVNSLGGGTGEARPGRLRLVRGKAPGPRCGGGNPGADSPLETGLAASPVFVFLGARVSRSGRLVGDELEQAAVGIAEVHARAEAPGSETFHWAGLDLDAVALQVGDRLGGGARPHEAEVAVTRPHGQACDIARHVDARPVDVELRVAEPVRDAARA